MTRAESNQFAGDDEDAVAATPESFISGVNPRSTLVGGGEIPTPKAFAPASCFPSSLQRLALSQIYKICDSVRLHQAISLDAATVTREIVIPGETFEEAAPLVQ